MVCELGVCVCVTGQCKGSLYNMSTLVTKMSL